MKQIPLTQGKFALVDDEDYDYLSQWKWSYHHTGYAVRTSWDGSKSHSIAMHRLIIKAPKNKQVDHINSDRLDNQKKNLRFCSSKQNNHNRTKRIGSASAYKGVYWHRKWKKWNVALGSGKTRIWLGAFDNERHAALVHDLWALDLYGEFAKTNFPVASHN